MGAWPLDPEDTKLLLLHVALGPLVLFLNFLFEMFQQSRFRFGREGRLSGWGAAASQGLPPGSSSVHTRC